MKAVGIFTNTGKDPMFEYTDKIIKWLLANDCEPLVTKDIAQALGYGDIGHSLEDILKLAAFFVVLGGDGTILPVAKRSSLAFKPLLGINLGTLGYLTDVDRANGIQALQRTLRGEYKLENRMMLSVDFFDEQGQKKRDYVLNDCVIRNATTKMIKIEISINDEYIDTLTADGIIVSTPTGSTAYNLSAGGAVLKPYSNIIAVTPICAHSLRARPFIVDGDDSIVIKVLNSSCGVALVLDGCQEQLCRDKKQVLLKKSVYDARIIKTRDKTFFDTLREKMSD